MRILLINKFFFPKGGADRHFFALKELLERQGHDVSVFAMAHPKNLPSPYGRFFVSQVNFERVQFGWQGLRAAGRMLWSFEARKKLEQLIAEAKPEIAHLHNIYHQISPSILPVLKKHGIPIVQTLHDYKLISPNYNLYAHGGVCTHGLGGGWYECAMHRCIKQSFAASLMESLEMTLHRWMRIYENGVDVFLCPSDFLLRMISLHASVRRSIRLPLFFDGVAEHSATVGTYALYAGRLSEEKGVMDLIHAMHGCAFPLKVAGDGPQRALLAGVIRSLGLRNVELLGNQSGDALNGLYDGARCVVVPSRCYENFPLAILEAYAHGKPVVAADHGGMRELVEEGATGYRFSPGSVDGLRAALSRLMNDQAEAQRIGGNAHNYVAQFSRDQFYSQLMNVYASVLAPHR
ncbi:MAG: glycosyltransferase family 4 protein [bacterium]